MGYPSVRDGLIDREDWSSRSEYTGTNCFTDNPWVECTYYPSSRTAVLTNNAEAEEATSVQIDEAKLDVHLGAHELRIIKC